MKKMKKAEPLQFVIILFLLFFCLTHNQVFAQTKEPWTVLLLHKGDALKEKADMASVCNTGFYLYRNCVYEIDLKNKVHLSGRLISMIPDTLYFTNYFNEEVARKDNIKFDTIAVYYRNLDRLNLIADRAYGIYNKIKFDNYDFIFKQSSRNFEFKSEWSQIYSNDAGKYELVPHLTAQGTGLLYEENGQTYFYYGPGMTKPDLSRVDYTYHRRVIFWFTPCHVEEIDGLALGFHTKNIKNRVFNQRDSLVVKGVSLEINPFALFGLPHIKLHGPYPDSLDLYNDKISKDWQVKVKGVHVSAINTINEMDLQGVNVTALITVIDEIHGISISGLNNFCYILKGLSIAAISNRATLAKGCQIGLFNKANDLIGIQLGLWNVNGKRSLPIINWQFRPAVKKI
jgi:hypothetical protein